MRRLFVALLASCWLLPTLLNGTAAASVPVEGSFKASDNCPAYASKRKQTNPGEVHLKPGTHYPVVEANKATSPDWLRVQIKDAQPPQRWVVITCGSASISQARTTPKRDNCNTPGLADSYVLALSWQPAFCQHNRNKPECQQEPSDNGFSLHGLWPNRKSCGIKYGFCGDYAQVQRPFCNYKSLDLNSDTRTQLETVMPSSKAGTCLQRHQWHKHGSCQTQWTADEYFNLSTELTETFRQSPAADFIRRHRGQHIRSQDLIQAFDQSFGDQTHQTLTLTCKGKMLTEIRLTLPQDLHLDESLDNALKRSSKHLNNRCGKHIYIDAPGP